MGTLKEEGVDQVTRHASFISGQCGDFMGRCVARLVRLNLGEGVPSLPSGSAPGCDVRTPANRTTSPQLDVYTIMAAECPHTTHCFLNVGFLSLSTASAPFTEYK